jgi:hypothetical protein
VGTLASGAHYHYSIAVYRLSDTSHFIRTLKFTGTTTYGDGVPMAVIDSEMPVIERHLNR